MRLPKRGFNNPFAKDYAELNVGALQQAIDAGKLAADGTLTQAELAAAGLVRGGKDGVRVLGKGTISAAVQLRVAGGLDRGAGTRGDAGGSVEVIEVTPAAEKHQAKHRKGISGQGRTREGKPAAE
jgi:large subunit ribosomal protein L15